MVGIVEAGQTVGYDLSGGSGGFFGGLLFGALLLCRLGLSGGSTNGQIVLGRDREGQLRAGDDEDLF